MLYPCATIYHYQMCQGFVCVLTSIPSATFTFVAEKSFTPVPHWAGSQLPKPVPKLNYHPHTVWPGGPNSVCENAFGV